MLDNSYSVYFCVYTFVFLLVYDSANTASLIIIKHLCRYRLQDHRMHIYHHEFLKKNIVHKRTMKNRNEKWMLPIYYVIIVLLYQILVFPQILIRGNVSSLVRCLSDHLDAMLPVEHDHTTM